MRRALPLFLLLAAGTVRAGPPAICWQIEIGDAKSLPWAGKDAFAKDQAYDSRRAVEDTLALLEPAMPVVVDWPLAEAGDGPRQTGETIVRSNGTAEAMWLSMSDHAAILGADGAGRLWHTGPPAACDALTTLAWLLRSISRHDNPLAERVRASV